MARANATRCCWPPDKAAIATGAEMFEMDERQSALDRRVDVAARSPARLQSERDIAVDGQMRKQGVGLEDKSDIAPVRRNAGDVAPRQFDGAEVGRF